MAEAIIAALVDRRAAGAGDILAADPSAARRNLVRRRYGVRTTVSNRRVLDRCRTIFLAVKPQNLDAVLDELAPEAGPGHLFISIAAGRLLAGIEQRLARSKAVRVMPNLPAQVAEGMSVYCSGSRASARDRRTVEKLLGCFGRVLEMDEKAFDAVTAVSGSGPAFLAYALDCLIRAGREEGLGPEESLLLAEQTMLGTARLLLEKGVSPDDLIRSVASPGGTTEAGLAVLTRSELRKTMQKTVRAAARRSRELSG